MSKPSERDSLSDRCAAARFTIRWTREGYKVSVPNLDTAEVVLASTYDSHLDKAIEVIEARERDMYDAMAEADRLRAENDRLREVAIGTSSAGGFYCKLCDSPAWSRPEHVIHDADCPMPPPELPPASDEEGRSDA